MKKIAVIIFSAVLIYKYLDYSGYFLDKTDPVEISKYFLDCLKRRDWFVTYPVFVNNKFAPAKLDREARENNCYLIDKVEYKLTSQKNDITVVNAEITYKDKAACTAVITMEKKGNNMLISDFEFKKNNLRNKK